MQELRLVAVSEDGTYLVLATAGRGTRFTLPVDDRLRAAVRGHFSRLGQFEIEVESPLRPKEIQARIRSGETAEEIAESAGIPVERVRWFEGPVLQEREYMAQQAQRVTVRRPGESTPGPPLGETVEERLGRGGVDLDEVEWDSWKCEDSTWRVRLSFFDNGRPHAAEWVFDPRRRHVSPLDEVAARLTAVEWGDDSLNDTVTPLVPRRPAMKVVSDREQQRPTDARREYIVERGRMVDPRPAPAPAPTPAPAPAPPTETPRETAVAARLEPPAVRVATPTADNWDDGRRTIHEATSEDRPAPAPERGERPLAPAAVSDERATPAESRDDSHETDAARDERPAARQEERSASQPAAREDERSASQPASQPASREREDERSAAREDENAAARAEEARAAREEQAAAAQEERATVFARPEEPAKPTPVEVAAVQEEEPSQDADPVHEEASAPAQDERDVQPTSAAAEVVEREAPAEVAAAEVAAAEVAAAEVTDPAPAQDVDPAPEASMRPAPAPVPEPASEAADELAPQDAEASDDELEASTEADDELPAAPKPAESKPKQQAPKPQPQRREAPRTPAKKKPTGRPTMPAADKPGSEPAAAANSEPPAAPQRPAARNRRKAKGKRASVPSWDEIMFGARRPE
ncbi:septation protein SepH [Actinomadura sp. 6N118]|uniref:septation protein SepH n=1 Tax=Actinomadura sp. 6N118 TaxID=3375151 RepID=UPI0037A552AD